MKEVNGEYSKCHKGKHEDRIAMLHPGKIPEDATNEKRAPSFKEIDHRRFSKWGWVLLASNSCDEMRQSVPRVETCQESENNCDEHMTSFSFISCGKIIQVFFS